MVSGGCSASFNVPVESGIVRLKSDHKLGHLTVAFESPEAPFGFQGTGGAPAQDHAAALPSLDAFRALKFLFIRKSLEVRFSGMKRSATLEALRAGWSSNRRRPSYRLSG